MTVMEIEAVSIETTGGIPVAGDGAPVGSLVTRSGHLQYGSMLLGAGTPARRRALVGWRNTPEANLADTPRPQAHGVYPGDIYGSELVVTYVFLLTGTPESKALAKDTIEAHTRLDGVERPLVVNDGTGPWVRWARVIAREIPDEDFTTAPVECSIQWVCADPRRYSMSEVLLGLTLPESSGGLEYSLAYPLDYGTFSVGSLAATNTGSESTPVVATFHGPLTDPTLTTPDWRLGFTIVLAEGETLVVDTFEGTVLLNGRTDRLYTITTTSDPIERALLKPGTTDVALIAAAGSGRLDLTYRHARM